MKTLIISLDKDNLTKTVEKVNKALEPQDLMESVFTLTTMKKLLESAKTTLKQAMLEPQAQIKAFETQFNKLETLIKDKFLSVYEKKEIVVPKRTYNPDTQKWEYVSDEETGEIETKVKEIDNKGLGMFTYTPSIETEELDTKMFNHYASLWEDYKHNPDFLEDPTLCKLCYDLSIKETTYRPSKLIREEDFDKLPKIKVVKKESCGIQWKKVEEKLNGISNKK